MLKRITLKKEKKPGYVRCIGCDKLTNPGFSYTGQMIVGVRFHTLRGIETLPIKGYIETYEKTYVIGGENVETQRKVSFLNRKKGIICTECAANYHSIKDNRGNLQQVVKLDARPGFLGSTAQQELGQGSYKTLNTRYTQGKKGRRM